MTYTGKKDVEKGRVLERQEGISKKNNKLQNNSATGVPDCYADSECGSEPGVNKDIRKKNKKSFLSGCEVPSFFYNEFIVVLFVLNSQWFVFLSHS